MLIFAVDASSCSCSAAVWRDGLILSESFCDVGLTHSETLMPLCDETFRRAGVSPADVGLYAVTSGPGSFTGLRIGIGAVKGMAFARDTRCAAVPTLEALAYNLCPNDRVVVPLLDARRGRVYAAAYDCSGGFPSPLFENEVLGYSELAGRLAGRRAVFLGDGAPLCYNETAGAGDFTLAPAGSQRVRAANVAEAAKARFDRGLTCDCGALAPEYIQLPQAERERLARKKQEAEQK